MRRERDAGKLTPKKYRKCSFIGQSVDGRNLEFGHSESKRASSSPLRLYLRALLISSRTKEKEKEKTEKKVIAMEVGECPFLFVFFSFSFFFHERRCAREPHGRRAETSMPVSRARNNVSSRCALFHSRHARLTRAVRQRCPVENRARGDVRAGP